MKNTAFLVVLFLFSACQQKTIDKAVKQDTAVAINAKPAKPASHKALQTDTLQYIHFEGNYDYWYAVFINKKKDTIQLVVDGQPPAKYRNKLLAATWFTDTLFEAGDNDSKYPAKRLKELHPVAGNLFSAPPTVQKVIKDIESLPEVSANADQTGIAEHPTNDKEYYLVETGTHGEDNYSRLFMFRVYVYPKYQIRYYDPAKDTDISLEEWRSSHP